MPKKIPDTNLSFIKIDGAINSDIPISALFSGFNSIGFLIVGRKNRIEFYFTTPEQKRLELASSLAAFCINPPDMAEHDILKDLLDKTASLYLLTGVPKPEENFYDALRYIYGQEWWVFVFTKGVDSEYLINIREMLLAEINKSGGYTQAHIEYYLDLLGKYLDYIQEGMGDGMHKTSIFFGAERANTVHVLKSLFSNLFNGSILEGINAVELDPRYKENVHSMTSLQDMSDGKASHPFTSPRYSTLLSSADLASLICLPEKDLPGFRVDNVPDFNLNVEGSGPIKLGQILWKTTPTGNSLSMTTQQLTRHVVIIGIPGKGKTNLTFLKLSQLVVPWLVIEPAKSEYRELLEQNPECVYTVGKEDINPFKFNPFYVPEGVRVGRHIGMLSQVLRISFPMYASLPYLLVKAINRIYIKHGWDIVYNRRGVTVPTMADLYTELEQVSTSPGYSSDLSLDVLGALRSRIGDLLEPPKSLIFDPQEHMIEDLLNKRAVLELMELTDDDKSLVMGLVFGTIYEIFEAKGSSPDLRYQIVIEEAHRLFPANSDMGQNENVGNPRGGVVETLCNYLAEVRGLGVGITLVDQSPPALAPQAIRIPATKLAFGIQAGEDRKILSEAMGLSEEQSDYLGNLSPGRAICALDSGKPVLVDIQNLKKGIAIKDEEIRRRKGSSDAVKEFEKRFNRIQQ
ncbi:MAG: ATP-binding protein [Thaumarchaeota archaeon]|nr:ATP-binding protein [Nitrososphaerota archaeon]MDE1877819.1 ATP-binding protein [Nitrososphaerota archaeon]